MITSTVKTSLLVTMMSIALFGCGSDNSSSQNSTQGDNGSNTPEGNEPEVTVDKLELNDFNVLGRAGSQTIYRNQLIGSESSMADEGHTRIFETDCSSPGCDSSFGESYYEWDQISPSFAVVGDSFSSNTNDAEIYSDKTVLNFDMLDKTLNRVEKYQLHYTPIDLEGHSVADSQLATESNKGIATAFSRLAQLPADLVFPKGSVCFVASYQQASIPLFKHANSTGTSLSPYQSLDDWQTFVVNQLGDFKTSISNQVGSNNDGEARKLIYAYTNQDLRRFPSVNLETDSTTGAVTFNLSALSFGSVQNAIYIPNARQDLNNINKNKGLVKCNTVNDVAADFLEREIVKYY